MEVTINLGAEQAQKLAYIRQHGQKDPGELIHQAVESAIDTYYRKLQDSPQTALERFQAFGLVGCMNGSEELPPTDQPSIRDYLNQKRQQGRL